MADTVITFDTPVVPPAPYAPIVSVVKGTTHDDSSRKRAWVTLKDVEMTLTLWIGAAYDAAGQWTDADVVLRIKELAANGTFLTEYVKSRPRNRE